MADDDFTVEGTDFTYREWSEGYLNLHLSELCQSINYKDIWTLEMAFMAAAAEGFTVGYRVMFPNVKTKVLCEITWVRAEELVTMIVYESTDEIRQLVKHGTREPVPATREQLYGKNSKFRRA